MISSTQAVCENAEPNHRRASVSRAWVGAAASASGRNFPVLICGLSVHFSSVNEMTTVSTPAPRGRRPGLVR